MPRRTRRRSIFAATLAGLAALGRVARAAPLLTDPDAELRARAACLVLAAPR